MPSGGNGSISIDVKARVMGYEDSINKMKKLLENVGENSSLGKSLAAEIATAEKKLASLKKNFNLEASTGGQIHNIVKEVNSIGDALMNVAEKAQNLTGRDLKFDSLGDEVKELVNDLAAANRDLEGSVAGGMKSFIESSQDLKKTLSEILNIDVSKLDSEEIFKRMGKAAKDASEDVRKAEKAYKNAQQNEKNAREASDKQVARQNSNQAILEDIREQEKIYTNAAKQYQERITKAVQKVFSEEKAVEGQNILDSFFKDLNPENEKEKIEKAVNDINKLLGEKKFNITSFKDTFLGVKPRRSAFTNQELKAMADAEAKIREDINNSTELKSQTKRSALNLLDEHKIEESVKKTVDKLEKARDTVTDAVENAQNKVAEAAAKTESAKTSYDEAITQASTINQAQGTLDNQYQQLLQQNEQLTQRVQELEERLNAALSQAAGEVKTSFAKEGKRQPEFQISTEEAQRYEQQLERVKSAEQALGKLKGLITQWFSIYSVVRMASGAIREIISTISSLDKVITEIAIVTNMTQSELWGQMDSYAQMAQTYAASIEGVYQVSQLYYQQGLQTADVMALTEQTLKMARISGLDYAAATNYMTNAIRAFKMEMTDAQRVVDVYSAIAAKSATDTTELAEAMSKTASSAEAVGSSFENTTAMMAVMIESTRESASNIGSAMKSIISRYGEMTADPSALVDSEGQEMSLNRVDKALQSVGISIHDAAGQFRDFDDVIMELAASWDNIDRNTQRYIATIMAGNRLIMLAVTCAAFIIAQTKMA